MSLPTGDALDQLPVDKSMPSHDEINMVNMLFKKEKSTMAKIFDEIKSVLFVAALFIIFSLPIIDTTLHNLIPITQTSWMILISIKAVAVMIIYYLISNIGIIRNTVN